MATSYNQTVSQIITDSLSLLGVYGQGDTVSTNDYNFCLNLINKMVKAWEGRGIHLWTSVEGAVYFTVGQIFYDLASTSTDHAGQDPIFNQLVTTCNSSLVNVGSTFMMKVGDHIGIQLDSNVLFWSTIATIVDGANVTMNAGVPSTASNGNSVFSYTLEMDRPLMIINNSVRYYNQSGVERPIQLRGRSEFMAIPNKSVEGQANQAFYSPHVSDARIYIWPTAFSVGDCLRFSYIRRIADFVNSTDTPDLPQEWLECLTYNLAVRAAPSYGLILEKVNPDISAIASQSLQAMELFDSEDGDLNICPNFDFSDNE